MNFARLNHILIPTTREERERFRKGRLGKLFAPLSWIYTAFSDEGRVLAVLCLFVGTAGLEVDRTEIHLLWALVTALIAATLTIRRFFRLDGLRIEVSAAARVSVDQPLTIGLTLVNQSPSDQLAVRVRGPFLPWDGRYLEQPCSVPSLEPGQSRRVEVRARFVQRGHHHLDPFRAVALAPLGLTVGPAIDSATCKFVVVPRIAVLESLTLPLGRSYQQGGVANASLTGEAMELMGVRPYRRGDAVRDLHTRTWARSGVPHVREYQQEYFTRVGVIVDSDRRVSTEQGFEATISLAAGVLARLVRGESLVDVLVVGEELHTLTMGRSLGNLDQALDVLACAELGASPNQRELLARLEPFLSRLSAVVMITQSDDTSRLELADAFEQRGVAPLMLRVHDASPSVPWTKREPAAPPRRRWERVVDARTISEGEPLVL